MKPKKTKGKRQASKRPTSGIATTDLLKIADKVAFQGYAAAGIGQTKARAMRALQRVYAGKDERDETKDQTILIVRAMADAGQVSEDFSFALLAAAAEDTAWEDARIQQLSKAIEAWYQANGAADDEHLPKGEGPADFEALRDEFDERFQMIQVAVLRRHEADDMVDLLLNDPEKYKARYDKGIKDGEALRKADGNTGS